MENYPAGQECLGFETITVSTDAIGLTIPAGSKRAEMSVEGGDFRFRLDGTDPTASVGEISLDTVRLVLYGPAVLKNFSAIRDAAADVTLSVHYFG